MKEINKDNLILENYKTEFSYEANKSNLNISFNRVAFVFFIFLIIFSIYSIKIFYLGSLNWNQQKKNANQIQNNFRADIVDINNSIIAKTVKTLTVGLNPNLIIDEKKLLINLKIIFPKKDFREVKKKIKKKKYFRLEKELTQDQINSFDFWAINQ